MRGVAIALAALAEIRPRKARRFISEHTSFNILNGCAYASNAGVETPA
jgi:hypothetical protein